MKKMVTKSQTVLQKAVVKKYGGNVSEDMSGKHPSVQEIKGGGVLIVQVRKF